MKKKVITLSCIAAVAIATFVGKKTFESNAYGSNGLLIQNVEALAQNDAGDAGDQSGSGYTHPNAYPYEMVCEVRLNWHKKCGQHYITCQGSGYGCNQTHCPTHNSY